MSKTKPQFDPCPPSLIVVKDVLMRYPENASEFLEQTILDRTRLKKLFETVHRTTSFQFFATIKGVLFVGVSIFSVLWAIGAVVQVAQWVSKASLSDLSPVATMLLGSNAKHTPIVTGQSWLSRLAQLPIIDWRDATLWATIIMVLIALERFYTSYATWRDTQFLRQGQAELEAEIMVLEAWKKNIG